MKAIVTIFLGLTAVVGLSLTSCRSSQQESTRQLYETVNFDIEKSWNSITGTYADWNDVELPVKVNLTKPRSFSLSGKAKIINGTAIYMSFRKIGIEVATLYLDNEKVLFISKPLRVAWSEDVSELREYNINLQDLQSALLGRLFMPGIGEVRQESRTSFNLMSADPGSDGEVIWTAKPDNFSDMLCFFLTSTGETTYLSNLQIHVGKDVDISYGLPETTSCGAFASSMSATALYSDTEVAANISWSMDKAKWNKDIDIQSPEIPQSCQLLTTAKLLKLLKGI